MHIEVATNDVRHTDTTSAHDRVTSASDQRQHSTGVRSRGSSSVTRASAQPQSNIETQFSANQKEELAKMFADFLERAGVGPVTTRA